MESDICHPFPFPFPVPVPLLYPPFPNAVPTNTTCTAANESDAVKTSTLFASVKKAKADAKTPLKSTTKMRRQSGESIK